MTVRVEVTAEHEAALCKARTLLKQIAVDNNDYSIACVVLQLDDLISAIRNAPVFAWRDDRLRRLAELDMQAHG